MEGPHIGTEREGGGAAWGSDHIRAVARREAKNLAKSFQEAWRGDGTLRNLHGARWWKLDDPMVAPLASDTAGMMKADPGRHEEIDDEIPDKQCTLAAHTYEWVRYHKEMCEHCRHGEDGMFMLSM